MTAAQDIVVLLDCDNTLLDNDAVQVDLRAYLSRELGDACRDRYWSLLEELRSEVGYVDYLGALQRYRLELKSDPRILGMSSFMVDYPFGARVYPGALDAIRHLRTWGQTVILSDGDVVFQPRKIHRSGLWDAVDGRVLIYVHKEEMLDAVAERYPARHYVMVDDKVRILTAMKQIWRDRLTTVFARQGHYALDPKIVNAYPAADATVERIGDLAGWELSALPGARRG
jgi:FMN phosphatase YigB (HAD superfamily)